VIVMVAGKNRVAARNRVAVRNRVSSCGLIGGLRNSPQKPGF
jgi:hypothetical protein